MRRRIQALLRFVARSLHDRGVTASDMALATTAGSLLVSTLVMIAWPSRSMFLLLAAWLLARNSMSWLACRLDRQHGQAGRLGVYLEELGGVVSDIVLCMPLMLIPSLGVPGMAMMVLMVAVCEHAGSMGGDIGRGRRRDGPLDRDARNLVLGVLALWTGLGLPTPWVFIVIPWAMVAGLAVTTWNRAAAVVFGDG